MNTGSYDVRQSHRDPQSEIDRLRAQSAGWLKELSKLRSFGLSDGQSVLEIGSGPGYITSLLLESLPTSRITAIEIDPELVEQSRTFLGERGNGRLAVLQGSVMQTGLPEASFDFAIARLVFQHLPDPVGAAQAIWRLLKPGGQLVIIDSDDGLWGISEPELPEMDTALRTYGLAQAAQGGNRQVGRTLLRVLDQAGFVNCELEALVNHSDQLGIDSLLPHLDPDRLLPLVAAGLMSESALNAFRVSHQRFLETQDPILIMVLLMACGQRPD